MGYLTSGVDGILLGVIATVDGLLLGVIATVDGLLLGVIAIINSCIRDQSEREYNLCICYKL